MSFEQKARERLEDLKEARENLVKQFEQVNVAIGELEGLLKEEEDNEGE